MKVLYSSPALMTSSTTAETPPWVKPKPVSCRWIHHPDCQAAPFVTVYRNAFQVEEDTNVTFHVAADERYELYLDGRRVGRGNDRGDRSEWYFDTYKFTLHAGKHMLAARTWALGRLAPWAQVTIRPGFILAPDDPSDNAWLGTGVAQWEVARVEGYSFRDVNTLGIGTGAKSILDGSKFPWGFELGSHCDWRIAEAGEYWNDGRTGFISVGEHVLVPSILQAQLNEPISGISVRHVDDAAMGQFPEQARPLHAAENMLKEISDWTNLLQGYPLTVPPQTSRRIIMDMQNYYCLYPAIVVSGGAGSVIRCSFAEKLYRAPEGRGYGHRHVLEGTYFRGVGDEFLTDGGDNRTFEPLWWHAGRYVQLEISTGPEPITIKRLTFEETRYPIEPTAQPKCDDRLLSVVLEKSLRTLQMCSHETFMDCPYWEQLMYVGDTRIESLIAYAITPDDALQRKAIRLFENSRLHPGALIACSAPSTSKIIPSFIFWWVAMVHDYAVYRNGRSFVLERMPVVRDMLDRLCSLRQGDGLLVAPPGWNYMDVPTGSSDWKYGIPADHGTGANAAYNWLAVYTLRIAERLETYSGEEELSSRWRLMADRLQSSIDRIYWVETHGLYSDTHAGRSFSEQTQCLALLSMAMRDGESGGKRDRLAHHLFESEGLLRSSIFFTHYYFETCRLTRRMDKFYERLADWRQVEEEGLMTTPEHWGTTRSDCHAWGAHPLFHYYSTILGIRPSRFEFGSVEIEPMLGNMGYAAGVMTSPRGPISADFRRADTGHLHVRIELPESLEGRFLYNGYSRSLSPGKHSFICEPVIPS